MEEGADINAQGYAGDSALHSATNREHSRVLPLLLEYGADLEFQGLHKMTPPFNAASWGTESYAQVLLGAGADLNAKSAFGATALHSAAWSGRIGMVQLLLDAGADVEAVAEPFNEHYPSDTARTALQLAERTRRWDVVKMLTEALKRR